MSGTNNLLQDIFFWDFCLNEQPEQAVEASLTILH